MPVLGVTGVFGSGKSTVVGMFKKRGALVFDADKTVHGLLAGRGAAVKAIIKTFGPAVASSGGIDHAKLAAVVFDDRKKMKKLTNILHPFAKQQAELFVRRNTRRKLLVMDVPLLIEAGWHKMVDKVVVVKAQREQLLERVQKRSGIGRTQTLKRISFQMSLKDKLKFADYVVDNRGSQADTDKQVERIIEDLKKAAFTRK